MVSRRGFIAAGLGSAGLVALGGGLMRAAGNGVFSAGEGVAFEAWDAPLEGAVGVAAAGALAASSHNTQPWAFRIREDGLDVLGDHERLMGAADPRLRELHISLGCALENIALAAAAQGLKAEVTMVRDGSDHFARVDLTVGQPDTSHVALAERIRSRRTNRGAYDLERSVDAADLEFLSELADGDIGVRWLVDGDERSAFGELTVRATEAHIADEELQRDSHRWYRMRWSDVEAHKDGITVDGAAAGVVGTAFLKLFPPTPGAFDAQWAKVTADTHCGTAPVYGLLVVSRADDHAAWVEAGRIYQRMQLAADGMGIALHPLSQALTMRDRGLAAGRRNEYAEALDAYVDAGEVVLAFRVGYPLADVPRSPRRPVSEALVPVDR